MQRWNLFLDRIGTLHHLRLGLLLYHRVIELRGNASRFRLPRMHDGQLGGRYLLVIHGPCGDAIQQPDVLGNRDYLQRSRHLTVFHLSIRSNNKLQLGRLDER